jgi:hypothetical protein
LDERVENGQISARDVPSGTVSDNYMSYEGRKLYADDDSVHSVHTDDDLGVRSVPSTAVNAVKKPTPNNSSKVNNTPLIGDHQNISFLSKIIFKFPPNTQSEGKTNLTAESVEMRHSKNSDNVLDPMLNESSKLNDSLDEMGSTIVSSARKEDCSARKDNSNRRNTTFNFNFWEMRVNNFKQREGL